MTRASAVRDHPGRAVEGAVAALTPSAESLRELAAAFRAAVTRGLAGEPSSLRVLRTFVEQPRGDERGQVAVVDWGGTNGRAALVELAGGEVHTLAEHAVVFEESDKAGSAERVFDWIAAAVARVVAGKTAESLPLGFVYSFPARLEAIDRAFALAGTKGWRLSGLIGREVVTILQAALVRRGLGGIRVRAVANDTVAVLATQSYRARGGDPAARPADIGLIVGTGTNQAVDLGTAGIRNLESGNFDEVERVTASWDRDLDRALADPAPGAQRFEKIVGGHYLGEIVRRAARDLGGGTGLFRSARALDRPWSLDGAQVSTIASDESRARSETDRVLRALGVSSSLAERNGLRELARAAGKRSGRLLAAQLLGTLAFIDPDLAAEHTIAVDGSLYGGYPGFAEIVRDGFRELAGTERAARLRLAYVRHSTAAGGAVIAAVAARLARARPGLRGERA